MSDEPPRRIALGFSDARDAREKRPTTGLESRFGVTAAITIVCVALFLLRYVWRDGGDTEHLLRMGANLGPRVKAGEVHRLLASAFLHGDVIHLVANAVALWSFGPVLEALLGPRRYLVLYGVSALVGSLASAFMTEPRMSVGASGAVWGLMTAGIALVYRPQGLLPASSLGAARQRAWAPLALNLMYSFRPGIDLLAHLGGGAAGAALMLSGVITRDLPPVGSPASRLRRGDTPLWTALSALLALAMGASVVAAFVLGKPWEAGAPPVFARTAIGDTGVTVELPQGTASRLQVETDRGAPSYVYGRSGEDPMLIEIKAQKLEAPIAPDAVETTLEELRGDLESKPTEDATRVAPPRLATVGGRRAVVLDEKLKNGVAVKSTFLIASSHLVVVRTYEIADRPKSWADVEERMVGSVEAR